MKMRLKSLSAGVASVTVLAASAGLVLGATGIASAAVAGSPYNTPTTTAANADPNAIGTLSFYDGAGNKIIGGTLSGAPFANFAEGDTSDAFADTKATLFAAVPVAGSPVGAASPQQESLSNTFPNPAAPAPLNNGTTGAGLPLTNIPAGTTMSSVLAGFTALPTTGPYANLIQFRLRTSTANTTQYWEAAISINQSAGTWSVAFPAPVLQSTTTTLTTNPAGSANSGTPVTLSATVSPAAPGTVQFFDGTTSLGTSPVSGGVATLTTSAIVNPPASHTLTATYTPSAGASFSGSTSAPVTFTSTAAPAQTTSITMTVNTGSATAQTPVTFTATVTPGTAPGTVTFSDSGSPVGTTAAGSGTFTLVTSGLGAGAHSVVATFNPTNTANFTTSSSSPPVTFTLASPAFGNSVPQTITATVGAGTLNIASPFSSANPLSLGVLALNAAGNQLSASAAFGTAGANGANEILITDTRSGQPIPWTVKVLAGALSNGPAKINGENLGLTNLTLDPIAGNSFDASLAPAGNVAITDIPAPATAVSPTDPGAQGLGGTTPHTVLHANNGQGTVGVNGTLTLVAPTSATAGTYTGTITLTIG